MSTAPDADFAGSIPGTYERLTSRFDSGPFDNRMSALVVSAWRSAQGA